MFYFVEEVVNYTHRAGDNIISHSHGGCEIIIYKGGSGVATVEHEEFIYNDLSLLIVPAGRVHFERTLLRTDVRACAYRTDYFNVDRPVMIHAPQFGALIEKCYSMLGTMAEIYFSHDRDGAELENQLALLLYSVRYLCEVRDSKLNAHAVSVCNNTKNYILANFNKDINFPILAENVGYSYDRFRHIFVSIAGMGLKAYLQGVRMSCAKEMLTSTSKTVQEIALKCGYQNPVCFMNYFKRSMGMTPSQYREYSRMETLTMTFNLAAPKE